MEIKQDLDSFNKSHSESLPILARECIDRFLNDVRGLGDYERVGNNFLPADVQMLLTALAALRSEFTYIISDREAISKRITERAFIHLQRSIVVDSEIRKKWQEAFSEREEQCEQLGAVHLLSHGIWAFKVNAAGGRTDLIMNEPLPSFTEIEGAVDALVLTEWKLVRTNAELFGKIESAKRQAAIYSTGVLGAVELAYYRYLVMVSEHNMAMPEDEIVGAVKYRHINIAVNPLTPSAAALAT